MITKIKTLLLPLRPPAATRLLRVVTHDSIPLRSDLVPVMGSGGEWRFDCNEPTAVSLFELGKLRAHCCQLTCRAELCSETRPNTACLELTCHLRDEPPLQRRSWPRQVTAGPNWDYFEITLRLERGQAPESILLGLAKDKPGPIRIRNIQVLITPTE